MDKLLLLKRSLSFILLFTIALSSVIMLIDKIDINKTQKGQTKMGTAYNPNNSPYASSTSDVPQSTNQPGYNQVNQPILAPRESYTYTPNGSGGVNYFQGGNAISNTDYGRATGADYGAIERQAASDYAGIGVLGNSVVTPLNTNSATNAANNALRTGFNNQKQNIYGSANDAATNLQGSLGLSILDTIKGFTRSQEAIDRKNVQNESSRIQGGRDILSMIGRGIQSGGVRLAQGNAGSSSAAQAIANAYAQLGQGEMSKVGNQYAENADNIGLEQKYLSEDQMAAPDKFKIQIEQNVNNIVSSARDQFAQLDAAMANASLPDRIAIEQEKEAVRQQVLGKLSQFDTQLRTGISGVKAADRGTNIASANTRLSAGQADPNLFNYTTEAPAQLQSTGPSASTLPIFTYNQKNKTQFA